MTSRTHIDILTITIIPSLLHMSLEPVKAIETCKNSKVDVIIIVPSSVPNHKARQAVRESWGAHLPPSWPLVFYIGATSNSSQQVSIFTKAVVISCIHNLSFLASIPDHSSLDESFSLCFK